MSVELLIEQHLEFPSFKGGCTGSAESTHVKIPHCWKSHVTAHLLFSRIETVFHEDISDQVGKIRQFHVGRVY